MKPTLWLQPEDCGGLNASNQSQAWSRSFIGASNSTFVKCILLDSNALIGRLLCGDSTDINEFTAQPTRNHDQANANSRKQNRKIIARSALRAQPERHAIESDGQWIDHHMRDRDGLCCRIGQSCEVDKSRHRGDQRANDAASQSVKCYVVPDQTTPAEFEDKIADD